MMSTPLLAFLFDFSFPFIGEEKKIAVSFIEYYKHVGFGNFIVLFAFGSGEDGTRQVFCPPSVCTSCLHGQIEVIFLELEQPAWFWNFGSKQKDTVCMGIKNYILKKFLKFGKMFGQRLLVNGYFKSQPNSWLCHQQELKLEALVTV